MIVRQTIRLGSTVQRFNSKRNAMVFKRVYPPKRLPESATQEEINKSVVTEDFRHFRYDVVEETDAEPADIKVLLLKSSEEFGRRGQIRSINARIARQELLLPGLGIYASPYNLEKYKKIVLPEDSVQFSSETVSKCVADMSKYVVPIIMNGDNRWTLEPWHVRFALLNHGVSLEEHCIKLPDQKISGPNQTLEGKEFLLTLQINDFERAKIRAVLFHKSIEDRSELPPLHWEKRFYEPMFSDEAEELRMLPRDPVNSTDIFGLSDANEILEQYASWKSYRDKKLFG